MIRPNLLISLLLLFTCFAAAEERYFNKEHGFSVIVPATWKEIPPTDEDEVAAWRRPDTDAEASVMSIEVGEASLEDIISALKEEMDPAQIKSQKAISLGGREAYRLVATEAEDVIVIHTFLVAHGRAFDMIVFGLASEYEKDPEPFLKIGESFLLEEGD